MTTTERILTDSHWESFVEDIAEGRLALISLKHGWGGMSLWTQNWIVYGAAVSSGILNDPECPVGSNVGI